MTEADDTARPATASDRDDWQSEAEQLRYARSMVGPEGWEELSPEALPRPEMRLLQELIDQWACVVFGETGHPYAADLWSVLSWRMVRGYGAAPESSESSEK